MLNFITTSLLLTMSISYISVGPDGLTDEQRSAVKQNKNPIISEKLKLKENDIRWWQDAKFGMFIHWGLYALPADSDTEWYMFNHQIPADEYAKYAQQFKGAKFDADAWAAAAKKAGMKYMVMVARHHDGFALWDSPSSYKGFTSMKTAAHRDFVKEYVAAARKAGLHPGIYYSPMDWRFPSYFHAKEMQENALLMKKQCYGQVEELMSKYGKIDVLWYDGGWLGHTGSDADAAWLWDPIKLNTMVRKLQPHVVINSRSGWEGDFKNEEGSWESTGGIRPYPWEKNFSITEGSWAYSKKYTTVMPLKQIIQHLVNAVCRNGNLLLNVGPDPDGLIPKEEIERLSEIGDWMNKYGESIYGTRGGPIQPTDHVCGTTYKGNVIYVHVITWPDKTLKIAPIKQKITASQCLNGYPIKVSQDENGITLFLNTDKTPDIDTIIKLTLDKPVDK